ncbi:NAD(P)/FAD-dependent oxidoreductase [Candidatus Uhrbacteria bacterium]|jgi:predicted Rossmann fold flavoprotein|nr:NAD(P)/FAD-dependent oxidoreductase [Candidatus Uhrbacteria bacterium]MBT7717730.1 NAD(P)/FAD-dependent oxidoreductase [Candidatus Uhrbacteria bacterium]
MKNETYDVIVVGGGPSGMMAAGRAGELGARVLLIEKNDRLGKKLSLTGGRRCNITNAEFDDHLFLDNFPESKQFLFSPFSQFNVEDTFKFFKNQNLPLVIEDRKRAFPKSQSAEDVSLALVDYMKESGGVTIKLDASIESLIETDGIIKGVKTSAGSFDASSIILATGGLAAPDTGSTGDGLSILEKLGHTIKEPDSNLSPLRTSSKWVHGLSGISVDDMVLRYKQDNKTQLKLRGRLLFTHFGISGPLVINSAFKVKTLLKDGPVEASIDLFPDHDLGSLDKFILDFFEQHGKKFVRTALKELLQNKLVDTVLKLPGLRFGDVPARDVSKEQRKLLVHTLKDLNFPIKGTMGLEWSIVADGGVIPQEVDFKTMSSKLFPNLYLIGDIIDINRPSGGFSLQLCWTTGYVAGSHAVQKSI